MRKQRIPFGGIIVLATLAGLFSRAANPLQSPDLKGPSATAKSAEARTFVFAGLSGVSPRFIDSGPDKGYGWSEYETHEIRKTLKEQGYNVVQEWMTPARIAHEFKVGNPICTYPVTWQNPNRLFASKPDRIYSVPMKLSGEESRKVLFRQEDMPKFAKHIDKKGDLNFDSLIQDQELKTLLIRDFDYGTLGNKLLTKDSHGDQVVRQEYSHHIILLLIKNNQQLIEMLNAGRFDYIFSDSIEDQDFETTKIPKAKFKEIIYQTWQTGHNIQDPNLWMTSIACSTHPLTMKLMPAINDKIRRLRTAEWLEAKMNYQKSLDPKAYAGGVLGNFRGPFEAGAADYWYPLQQKWFPGLALWPQASSETKKDLPPLPQRVPRKLGWIALSEEKGAVTILNESSPNYKEVMSNPFGNLFHFKGFPPEYFVRFLSPAQRKFYLKPQGLFAQPSAVPSFSQLQFNSFLESRKLTLFASGLGLAELKSVAPLFPNLREVVIFDAGTAETTYLVGLLPKELERLTLVNCSLTSSDIHIRIAGMPLRGLHLSASQVTRRQMATLISNIPASVIELSLGYHEGSFDREAVKAFEKRTWPNLRALDLEKSHLFDDQIESISKTIPEKLKRLNLGLNWFRGENIQFLEKLQDLEELHLPTGALSYPVSKPLRLSSRLKRLHLYVDRSDIDLLKKITLPQNLEALNLTGSAIGDLAIREALTHLASRVEYLNLSGTGLGAQSLQFLTQPGRFTRIQELVLNSLSLRDSDLEILAQGGFELERLSLADNRLQNGGAQLIARKWLPRLKSLDLSRNFITEAGVAALAQKFSPELQELSLGANASLDMQALAERLPKTLLKLDLQANQVSDREMQILAPFLPPSLSYLGLSFSDFTAEGAAHLAKHLPQQLQTLALDGTPIESVGLAHLSNALPPTLKSFTFGPVDAGHLAVSALSQNLPPALHYLKLERVVMQPASQAAFFKALPKSLSAFGLLSAPLSLEAAQALSLNWPNNLRQFFLQGTKLTDQKFTAMIRDLPPSIERFALIGAGVGDQGLLELSNLPLENLKFIEWFGNLFGNEAFATFLSTQRSIVAIMVGSNPNLREGLLTNVPSGNLEIARSLWLDGLALSEKTLVPLCRKLNPHFFNISIRSTRLSTQGVDEMLQALPSHLHGLLIRGTNIGEEGRAKIHHYSKEREQRTGLKLAVDE